MRSEVSLTKGSVYRSILAVALPAIGYMSLETLLSFIDTYWVSRLGVDAVGAVSASIYLVWIYFSLIEIISTGVISLVAQEAGAGREEGVSAAAFTGTYAVLALSLLLSLGGLALVDSYIDFFKLSARASFWSRDYLIVFLVTFPVSAFYYVAVSIYEGLGKTKIPFWSSLIVLVLNSLLDPVLIFWLKLEVLGASLASALAKVAATFYLWADLKGALGKRIIKPALVARMVLVGFPSSLYWLVSVFVFAFMNGLASRLAPHAVAAMGVGVRFESLTYIIATGLATAASSFVGQNFGAGNYERAKKGSLVALQLGIATASFLGVVFYTFSEPLSSIFLSGEALLLGSLYLKINAVSQPLFAISIIYEGIFIGRGRTLLPLLSAVFITGLRVPLAVLLSRAFGVAGIFSVFPLTNLLLDLTLTFFFSREKTSFQ